MNYYDILGIPKSASMAEIRAAYLIQIKYFHPDVFPGNPEIAKVKTTQLNEAYFVLSNAARRAAYDRTLIQEAESASAPPPPPPYQRQPYHSYSGAADNANPAGQNSQQNPKEESNSPDVTGFGKIAGVIFILILIIALAAYRNASNNPIRRRSHSLPRNPHRRSHILPRNPRRRSHSLPRNPFWISLRKMTLKSPRFRPNLSLQTVKSYMGKN